MTWKNCKKLIYQDLNRSSCRCNMRFAFRFLITNASFKMSFWFRIGTYLKERKMRFLYLVVFWHYKRLMYRTGIQLPIGTQVGGGLKFFHFSNIVVNEDAVIGENVSIYNGVTIGANLSPGISQKPPRIGNKVVICAGAKLIGDIDIGDNSIIGANSVVIKDVPANSVVVGVPARILSNKGEQYVNMYINHR